MEPVTMTEIKMHLRLTTDDHNIVLERYLRAARENAEAYTNRAFIQRTLELTYDHFDGELLIRKPPLQSVTSVKYIDTDGVEQTLDTSVYDVDTASEPGRITLAYNQSWPTIRDVVDAVKIRYVAGYASAGTSPDNYRVNIPNEAVLAILLLVGHYFRNAEATTDLKLMPLPMGYESLLAPLRVWHF